MNKTHALTASGAESHKQVPPEAHLTPSPEFLRRIARLLHTGQDSQLGTWRDHNTGSDDFNGMWHDGTLGDD